MEVLFEDNQILVVYKPYGILAQADGSTKADILSQAKAYIKAKYQKPGNVYLGLVHRLDINTEGLMVLARTSKAAKRLSEDIAKHNFNKQYLAIVEGVPQGKEITSYLSKNEKLRKAYIADKTTGKLAQLKYEVLKTFTYGSQIVSIVDITLLTGRFHQIRCQFASINHPLLGDVKYGSTNKFNGPVLQAYTLGFIHPVTKENMQFTKIDKTNLFAKL